MVKREVTKVKLAREEGWAPHQTLWDAFKCDTAERLFVLESMI